jgi:ATP:ADP antiporter, AAA family
MTASRLHAAALVTAAALIAQQVGANAIRDGLFLSLFPVQSLPYFMAGAALLAVTAAQLSGRLLTGYGPVRVAPALFAANAALFVVEWLLLGPQPRAAAVLLYLHSSVFGAIAISSFWSLLNERFDPHSAKPLMARVAGAATLGGLIGGVSAERVAALLPQGALLPMLGLVGGVCVAGARAVGTGTPANRSRNDETERTAGWLQLQRQPLLRDLAFVIALAAMVAALADYLLKAEAVAYFGKGPHLVRFFGLFYAGTALAAVLMQVSLGGVVLGRLGLGGSVASHPALVGTAALLGFFLPSPVRSIFPRGLDVVVRGSIFRAGYELLYTPVAEAAKRSAKSLIDVACDCAGKTTGALLILLLVGLAPSHPFVAVNLAAIIAACAELFFARRLRTDYVSALQGGLQRQSEELTQAVEYSMSDFTVAGGMAGLDQTAVLRALGAAGTPPTKSPITDPVVAAIVEFRSGDLLRIRAALRDPPKDPLIIGALIQLLARDDVVRMVVAALGAFGARAAGEMVSVLLDPVTSDVVRRRLPLALSSCPSPIARDGLLAALDGFDFEIRLRCGRALVALTDDHPELQILFPNALALAEQELKSGGEPQLVREHVFNLLALVLEREPVQIAARAFTTQDPYVRGTALEYLETVLPAHLFSALQPLLSATTSMPARRRPVTDVRAELIRAGATMTMSLDELRRALEATAPKET